MKLEDQMALDDELREEAFWEQTIREQENINYLIGLRKGIAQREDIDREAKRYYISLIKKQIKYLRR